RVSAAVVPPTSAYSASPKLTTSAARPKSAMAKTQLSHGRELSVVGGVLARALRRQGRRDERFALHAAGEVHVTPHLEQIRHGAVVHDRDDGALSVDVV